MEYIIEQYKTEERKQEVMDVCFYSSLSVFVISCVAMLGVVL